MVMFEGIVVRTLVYEWVLNGREMTGGRGERCGVLANNYCRCGREEV